MSKVLLPGGVVGVSVGRLVGWAAALLAALTMTLVFGAPVASAAYSVAGSFAGDGGGPGGSGSGNGQLSNPGQAGVLASAHKLYVADTGNNRVEVFDLSGDTGTYAAQVAVSPAPLGLAVDQSSGAVYVATVLGVKKFNSDLTPVSSGWTAPSAVGRLAVDPTTHDVLVADQDANLIRRYEQDGTANGSFAADRPLDVAVDSTGDVIVVTSTGDIITDCSQSSSVRRFTGAGSPQGTIGASLSFPGAVAVDPADDSVVVGSQVNQYNCETGLFPLVTVFDADGTETQSVSLSGNTYYTMIPGLAASGERSRSYVITKSPENDSFGNTKITVVRELAPPTATVSAPTAITPHTATFHGDVDANGGSTTYHFEYRLQGASAWGSSPDANAGSGGDPVPVSFDAAGLQGASTYEVRLVVQSGDGDMTTDPQVFQTPVNQPEVQTLAAVSVTDADARLKATLNPGGQSTTYQFQWGTTTSYGNLAPLSGSGPAGAGAVTIEVSEALHDLAPSTVYHYRVQATNASGTVEGADQTFTTNAPPGACVNDPIRLLQHAQTLPDCLAYEIVSPIDKGGYEVGDNNANPRVQFGVAADGDRVSYTGVYPLPGTRTGSLLAMLASRGPASWSNDGVFAPPGPLQSGTGIPGASASARVVTPDQRTSVYWDATTLPYGSLNVRRADGSVQRIADGGAGALCGAAAVGGCPGQMWGAGISDDGRHVLFASRWRLGPAVGLPGTDDILYEWIDTGGDGTLRVVNRTNSGTVSLLNAGPAELGGSTGDDEEGRGRGPRGLRHAVSDGSDGHSRIFFQNPAPESEQTPVGGPVYMRVDGTSTVEVSAPEAGYSPATQLRYLDATPDGRHVFFWAGSQLTHDATGGGAIYRFDTDADAGDGQLSFVAPAPTIPVNFVDPADPSNSMQPPSAIVSDSGSRLYFQDSEDLVVVDNGERRVVDAGALVAAGDTYNLLAGFREDRCPSVNVSPGDGRFLAFQAELGDGGTTLRIYDAKTDTLRTIAEDQTGAVASMKKTSAFTAICSDGGIGRYPRNVRTRVMSDDGRYVFFNTKQALVPQDTNAQTDTYRWSDGRIVLISNGTSAYASPFLGTDASGANAFFATRDPMAPQDGDHVYDIYDARIDGGYAVPQAPTCDGDGCQGGVTAAEVLPLAATVSFAGPGNASAPPDAPPPSGSVSAGKVKTVTGTAAKVKVKVGSAGSISIAGASTKKATRATSKAGTYTVKVSLTAKAVKTLARKKSLRVSVKVAFRPKAGKAVSKTLSLTFKQPKAKTKAKRRAAVRSTAKGGR